MGSVSSLFAGKREKLPMQMAADILCGRRMVVDGSRTSVSDGQ
jgi:hypothetical protein